MCSPVTQHTNQTPTKSTPIFHAGQLQNSNMLLPGTRPLKQHHKPSGLVVYHLPSNILPRISYYINFHWEVLSSNPRCILNNHLSYQINKYHNYSHVSLVKETVNQLMFCIFLSTVRNCFMVLWSWNRKKFKAKVCKILCLLRLGIQTTVTVVISFVVSLWIIKWLWELNLTNCNPLPFF